MGMIVLKRSYPARKYALVFLMCLGIALFAFSSNSIVRCPCCTMISIGPSRRFAEHILPNHGMGILGICTFSDFSLLWWCFRPSLGENCTAIYADIESSDVYYEYVVGTLSLPRYGSWSSGLSDSPCPHLWVLRAAILLKGELFVSMAFCRRHPEILLDLVWLGCTSGVGQHAIIFIIRNFNSLVLSIVTTTRWVPSLVWPWQEE